ncbi:glycerol-3-phosphate dehydrogenase [Radicibacter daui]|uniref:glycerol-3-phosphate dehydrogenase n=1 Tax=Radicibacter daui TaxID=3064829 RepID=UPI004046FFD4
MVEAGQPAAGVGQQVFDLAIIGGGINGCGIARDAAGRGLSVFLAEQDDLASATSSASTKLIHGGLRYLEYYEFRLVREALMEREVLLKAAPHIIWPLRFVLPHHKGLRPFWLLRLGLFLYDHLGGRKLLPATRVLDLKKAEPGEPLKPLFDRAFEYSDCWVQDSRLVALNAVDAAARGAEIAVRTRVTSARREGALWRVSVRDLVSGEERQVMARALINAAGPWVSKVISETVGSNSAEKVRLVKGSHIVTKKLFDHDRCYIFQNADGRIIFAIPYEQDFTLIGTTDVDFGSEPGMAKITDAEVDYLLAAAGEYFVQPLGRSDVVWTYSGVRPLYDDGASKAQAATRDYVLKLEGGEGEAPLLNIFGGKITTYRRLAEHALEKLAPALAGMGKPWTVGGTLPGGDFAPGDAGKLAGNLRARHPYLTDRHAARLVRHYGTGAARMLEGVTGAEGLGRLFGADLYEVEAAWLLAHEFARSAADILWRRTKLGLRLTAAEAEELQRWIDEAGQRLVAA